MKIEIVGDDILIERAAINDPVAASILEAENPDQRPNLLADMVEIGARVLQRQQDGVAGDLIRREMESLQVSIERQLESLAVASGQGFVEAMRPVLETVSQQLAGLGGRLDGVLAVQDKQRELDDERERGTAKGRSFEEEVAETIDAMARHKGDTCEHVGDSWNITGRAGDVVVGVEGASGPEQGRIVFEVKTGKLSRPEAMRELDRVRENRSADYAILVVADGRTPAGVEALREYGGDKMIITFDERQIGLELAYSLARARILTSSAEVVGIDTDRVRASIEQAVQQLDGVRAIKLKSTAIATASDEISEAVEAMTSAIRARLAAAVDALRSPET